MLYGNSGRQMVKAIPNTFILRTEQYVKCTPWIQIHAGEIKRIFRVIIP